MRLLLPVRVYMRNAEGCTQEALLGGRYAGVYATPRGQTGRHTTDPGAFEASLIKIQLTLMERLSGGGDRYERLAGMQDCVGVPIFHKKRKPPLRFYRFVQAKKLKEKQNGKDRSSPATASVTRGSAEDYASDPERFT